MGWKAGGTLAVLSVVVALAGCGSADKKGATTTTGDVAVTPTVTTPTETTQTGPTTTSAKGKTNAGSASSKSKKDKKSSVQAQADAAAKHLERKAKHHSSSSAGSSGDDGGSSASSSAPSAPTTPSPSPTASSDPTPTHKPTHKPAAKPSTPKQPKVLTGPLQATLAAPNHTPKVGHWPIKVTLTKGGEPAPGHVSYEFLFNGQVVSRQPVAQPPIPPGGAHTPNFTGTFHDVLTWPARAVGIPLTLRVTVKSKYGTKQLDWKVKVHK